MFSDLAKKRGDCCACPTATVYAYGKRTSFLNRKMHCVPRNIFIKIRTQTTRRPVEARTTCSDWGSSLQFDFLVISRYSDLLGLSDLIYYVCTTWYFIRMTLNLEHTTKYIVIKTNYPDKTTYFVELATCNLIITNYYVVPKTMNAVCMT